MATTPLPLSINTMAEVTVDNTISFSSISMSVKVKTDDTKSHFTPYVVVPNAIMNEIYEKFDIGCPAAGYHAQLLSLPDVVMDVDCTSGCTASVWSRVARRDMTLLGNYTFAVEKFNNDFFDWYIVATCERSVLHLY